MAQAGPVTDVVQRLFTELKSKNEEVRVRASFELYDNVLTVSRGGFHQAGLFDKLAYLLIALYRLGPREIPRILQCRQPAHRPTGRHGQRRE